MRDVQRPEPGGPVLELDAGWLQMPISQRPNGLDW